ncbi:phenylalanine--tRNA ligase subunit beta [Helicovermis profundi]|uniref:Phenylalanine--tRNA ligase beta subunit n=1 Tax=Helicovermis profundi TaxID=3065157 RepID=A0AAU9E280_9FIRM|nr:phenylalanine--tRNA ligase subunit beta [Clostridia bacterium S502]
MLIPVKWLNDYVDVKNIDIKELEDRLIMTGSNTETVTKITEKIEKIVVGKIKSIDKHPDADKLLIMQADVGEEENIQIVTGAKNCSVNDFVPVVRAGGKIADGTKIKKGKLRGEVSLGMFCSFEELGYDVKVIPKEYNDGIYILNGEYTPGEDIKTAIKELDDNIIEFEITPNRADCLSLIGMARETAATFERELVYPKIEINKEILDVNDFISVSIEDEKKCNRYVARVVKNVKIEPSPDWLKVKLMNAGMRPTNNIVDITNYVMLEYGQPIHAFDIDTLKDKKIVVRDAKIDESITTLDGKERTLDKEMLVIADGEKAVAIAGIMGGENTEISNSTKNILIEVAHFEKSNIRETSRKLGLRSEASSRFEKGISSKYCNTVVDRVCQLIEELSCGEIVKGSVDINPIKSNSVKIDARVKRINDLIGINLSAEEMLKIFEKLEFVAKINGDTIEVEIPQFRLDIESEIDLVEEIARMYGYDNIPLTLPKGSEWGAKTNGQNIEDIAKDILVAQGMNEITTYSFVSPKSLDLIRIQSESILRNQVTIINPLGEEYSVMRTSLVPNLLDIISRNYNRKVNDLRAFEIGNLFFTRVNDKNELPIEKKSMVIGTYGENEDFYTIKGMTEVLLNNLGIKNFDFVVEKNHPTYHPGRCANIIWGNHILGTIGEVHPEVLDNFNVDCKVYLAEIDFNIIMQITRLDVIYKPIPKYPSTSRDIALIVKDEVTNAQIIKIINENAGKLLEAVKLFDVYKGKQIEEGYKSMAYSLTFRSSEKTLVDEEVNVIYNKILDKLKEFGANLR